MTMMSAKFSFAFYVLLTALIVKNCQILDGIYFIFLKNVLDQPQRLSVANLHLSENK